MTMKWSRVIMAAERKVFHDSVVPIPVESGPAPNGLVVQNASEAHSEEKMDLHFSLALPDDAEAELEKLVERGETITPQERLTRFSARKKDADALSKWLTKNGFTVTHRSADNTSIYASATAAQITNKLQVAMARITRGGLTYTAARNAPSLPAGVGAPVVAIGGLQPFIQANKHLRAAPQEAAAVETAHFTITDILRTYAADALTSNSTPVTGEGQTIAILIDTFPADTDLEAFWKKNDIDIDIARIEKVNVAGSGLPAPTGEETLDVEWASGIAPAAKVRIYATGSLRFTDLDRALDAIIDDLPTHPEMRQLSISLGLGETYFGGPDGEVHTQHLKFTTLASSGVNVFVSSGDAGSNPGPDGHHADGPLQAEYESSDPCVVAVGGTTLALTALTAGGVGAAETGWPAGGGGRSIYFPRPAWQTGPHISGKRRLVPDVATAADPQPGGLVILNGKAIGVGGTSWSAPTWAGFCALINHARALAGKPALTFLNPLIYPLSGTACFRDITSGTNGAYHATTGYDLVTGLGVPNVRELINNL
jgi:kumamolisin